MSAWVEVGDADGPRVAFYLGRRPSGAAPLSRNTLAEIGKITRALAAVDEADGVSVAWVNRDGDTAALLQRLGPRPALRVLVDAGAGPVVVFDGELDGQPRGDQRLDGQAVAKGAPGEVPALRRASDAGEGYSADRVLTRVVGREVSVSTVPNGDDPQRQLIGDGALGPLHAVYDGDDLLNPRAYDYQRRADATGATVTELLLATPPSEPQRVTVIVDGEVDALATDAAPASAADVFYQAAGAAGIEIDRAAVDDARTRFSQRRVRGVIDTATAAGEQLASLAASAGLTYGLSAPRALHAWPPSRPDDAPLRGRLGLLTGWDVVSEPLPRVTRLTVRYAYDWSESRYTRRVVLRAPDVAAEIGRDVDGEVLLPYCADEALADSVGLALCAYQAASRYRVSWTSGRAYLTGAVPGAWWNLDHPLSPLAGAQLVVRAALDPLTLQTDVTAEGYTGDLPAVVLVERVIEPGLAGGNVTVLNTGGGAVLTIFERDTGNLLAAADVVINERRYVTDAAGRVFVPGVKSGDVLNITAINPTGPDVVSILEVP